MSHFTVGFTGQVDQVQAAKKAAATESRFTRSGPDSWRVDVVAGDRTVVVRAGVNNSICGLLDGTNADEAITFDSNQAGAPRWDLLIVRAVWAQDDSGTNSVAFDKVKGVAGAGLPAPEVLVRQPGVRYEAVLAAVRIDPGGGTFPSQGAVFDCGPWGGRGGPLVVADGTYLQYLDADIGQLVFDVSRAVDVRKNASGTWGQQSWVPTWAAGFSGTMRAVKASSGMVTLAGTISYGGTMTGSNIPDPFMLPEPYRPGATLKVSGTDQKASNADVVVVGTVNASGAVRLGLRSNPFASGVPVAYYSCSWLAAS